MIIKMKDKGYTVLEHSFSTHTYTHKKIQNTFKTQTLPLAL